MLQFEKAAHYEPHILSVLVIVVGKDLLLAFHADHENDMSTFHSFDAFTNFPVRKLTGAPEPRVD